MRRIARLAWQLLVCGAFLSACSNSVGPDEGLAAQIGALEHRADLVSDANDVKRLQRAYGFYWDKGIWDEVADLPEAALPPDRPPTVKYETYPTPGLVPYHYPNPVSGRAWKH
jgi:hypothetical protein